MASLSSDVPVKPKASAMLRAGRLVTLLLCIGALWFAWRWRSGLATEERLVFEEKTDDIPQYNEEPIEIGEPSFVRRVVAVGDLHGDMANALKVLQMADVVDHKGDWSGNIDFFVQTGDIIDRGDDTIKIFLWMERLRDQARSAGGEVFSNLGNHEMMNLLADWRYVHPSEIKTFGSVDSRIKMLQTGRIGRAWRHNYTITARVPLHPGAGPPNADYDAAINASTSQLSGSALSFVHGGLSPTYDHLSPYPSKINEIGATLVRRLQDRSMPPPHPPNPYYGMPEDASEDEKGLYDTNGPLWYRGWAQDSEDAVCSNIDPVLEKTGVRRLIMGHTPDFQHIVSRCHGKIIIIDTGISHAYGGVLSALNITYTLAPKKGAKDVWHERETISAIYPDRQDILVDETRTILGVY